MKDQVTSIEQSRRLLELKDIAGYLPHGLRVMNSVDMTIWTIDMLSTEVDYSTSILPTYHFTHVKPILRPMSDLTKEITHQGEKFVPLVKLAGILRPRFQWKLNEKGTGCVDVESPRHTFWFDGNSFFTRVFIPPFSKQLERVVIEPCDQIIGFDKLTAWLFDYRGLIPAGLAVDANTLPENPYGV